MKGIRKGMVGWQLRLGNDGNKNNGSNWKHTLKDERVIGKTTWTIVT
jgi:hypothetical protein